MRIAGLPMTSRRTASRTFLAVLVAVALGACGASSPSGSAGTSGKGASGKGTSGKGTSGKAIFSSAGCARCHTLAAAGASGSVGPNLDKLKPSEATVVRQVTHGGGGMPSFAGSLSQAQIEAVARYVASSAQ